MKSSFGRYIPGNSLVHGMNPMLKIVLNIVYIVLAFLTQNFFVFGILLIPLVAMNIISTKKVLPLLKMWITPIFIGLIVLFINFYLMHYKPSDQTTKTLEYYERFSGGLYANATVHKHVWHEGTFTFSTFAVLKTISIIIRIYIMILATTILTNTTKPIMLTVALEKLMFPLKIFFIPTQIISMIISIALRFIPTLLDETLRIMKAQASRGVDFKHGKFKEKAKSMITLVIPLFVTSFTKAEDLANAMETRGYNPYQKRTRYRKMTYLWQDYLVSFILIGLMVLVICSYAKVNVIPYPTWWLYGFAGF
ncbi:Energy-coupling factor transporter transmembrane protein EcfT [Mycoplasmopsis californica]|uniref:Energy-coupling factor transporter transmembrane protein EcfT n=1 Tax=Mycoplasmopsis equigenitalium TaxID=114883 RepID=A0ABY5J2R1_9BACT|nr:energy-coupling factor transporter transmembrane component T [Mycoplasmopsis equigenitalium]UUD37014.1 energy-coupling factor transporter transmembrane protein EcfT [Mycoplasmopsis equigenitalium]VEU69687.1 Energy-coupling factor transporter transmembrane protein EcfT [Mycoplasmopsis californica]